MKPHAPSCPMADPGAARRLRDAGQPVVSACTCGATERALAEQLAPGVQRIKDAAHVLADRIALGTALHGLLGMDGVERVVVEPRRVLVQYCGRLLPAEAEDGELIGDVAVATLAILRGERDWPWPGAECPRPPRVVPCTCPSPRLRPGHLPGCPRGGA